MTVPRCGSCGVLNCLQESPSETAPASCPAENFPDIISEAVIEYREDEQKRQLALAAARTEAEGYCRWSRVEETMAFARKIGARKIGIATCVGLLKESNILDDILTNNGFEVYCVCCKMGAVDKTEIGLKENEKIREGLFESICTPIAQARILNDLGTELNIMMGLCVGHDSIFLKESVAPTTVLVVKDRVLGHNPVAALYASHFYYGKLFSSR